jgi:uncharacterized membrane protein
MSKNENDKLVSILSYFLIGLIWFAADNKVRNANTTFHVKQGLNLFIINFVVSIVLTILATILGIISFGLISLGIFGLIFTVVRVFFLIAWILGLINAVKQEKTEIPLIGKYAKQYLNF